MTPLEMLSCLEVIGWTRLQFAINYGFDPCEVDNWLSGRSSPPEEVDARLSGQAEAIVAPSYSVPGDWLKLVADMEASARRLISKGY